MRLRLIGQMEVWTLTSESMLPLGRRTRALLAAIALSSPRPALRGWLAELLWSGRPEEQARASLRQEVHRLLEALVPGGSEVLNVTRDHLSLRPGKVWVDAEEVMRATANQPASLAFDLQQALRRGNCRLQIDLLVQQRLGDGPGAIAQSFALDTEPHIEGRIDAVQPLQQVAVHHDRAHEGAWRALMRGHAARGERGMAIQAYHRCRAVLADLLDASPSAETQIVLADIRGPSGSHIPRRPPAPPPPPARPPSLSPTFAEQPYQAPPAPEAMPQGNWPTRGGARVGVMPLQLVSSAEEDAHLAPGLTEEITTALARFRWMFVVASNSLARFAAENRDETAIRRSFGIDFLLDGSIQRVHNRIRITVRLLDLRAGDQVVWARRFDRQSNDLLSLQDEIASEVVAQIDPEILLIEAKRSASRPPTDATAYDLMLRSIPLIGRLEREAFMQAGEYLSRAIELEAEFAAAHAWYAYWLMFLVGQDWAADPTAAMQQAGLHAERAVALDPYDARGLTIAGHVRAFLHRRLHESIALHERALSLNPNLAMAWALSAIAYAYIGDPAEAERRHNRYKQLSPLDPHAFFFDAFFVLIRLQKRDYESAVAVARAVTEMNPSFSAAYKPYLSALGHLGRSLEAEMVWQRLQGIEPHFSVQRFIATSPLERKSDRDHYAEGLRLARVPESVAGAAQQMPEPPAPVAV